MKKKFSPSHFKLGQMAQYRPLCMKGIGDYLRYLPSYSRTLMLMSYRNTRKKPLIGFWGFMVNILPNN